MQSFLVSAIVASSTILSTAYAQTYPPVNVTDIDINVRNQWCVSQTASCRLLCENQEMKVAVNDCFPKNLFYTCTCSNGLSPNVTEYSQTIPYFTCTLEVSGCVENCKGDSTCGSACTANKRCGATDPTRVNATTTSSASGRTSATSTSVTQTDANGFLVTGTSTASTSSTANNAAGLLIEAGSAYGMGVLVAGVVAGLAIVGI